MTFAELEHLLLGRNRFGVKLGLERMRAALALLGDPHRSFRVLHVAGSNGKGSTCAFAEASLRAAGLRTGLYTSPHLRHFCERIRVQGAPLEEERAAALFGEILARIPWALRGSPTGDDGDGLTFFELATLLGLLAFARAGVEVAVVEVGLGGRLDATNVVEPVACAVASLGIEHAQYLGNTLEAIAGEKAGIFKRGVPAVSAGQPLEAARVLDAAARATGSTLWRPGRDYRFESREGQPFCYAGPRAGGLDWTVCPRGPLSLAGAFQRGNAALACALLEAAAQRGLPVLPEHVATGLVSARWPGRLEAVAHDPLVLVDGAHNPPAVRALAGALPDLLAGRPLILVFGAMADKDVDAMLGSLLPLARAAFFCAPGTDRALAPQSLLERARAVGPPGLPLSAHASPALAFEQARQAAGRDGAVLCCGSLYLVGEIEAVIAGGPRPMPGERL